MANTFDKKIDVAYRSNMLLGAALTSRDSIVNKKKEFKNELIVSLTSYSKRIHDVHLVVESIAQQTLQPNRLILWLDENEFTLETIPLILHKQIERGLEVRFCPNYRSYKKLIPTLKAFPEANIITIDDDILYPYDMVEVLMREHKEFPDAIIGNRVHSITLDKNGNILPYNEWIHETKDSSLSYCNVAIGVGGVFYPVNSLNSECFDEENRTKLSPTADDLWFKAMSLLNGVMCKKVRDDRAFWDRFLLIPNSQSIALFLANMDENKNDEQIKALFKKYKLLALLN